MKDDERGTSGGMKRPRNERVRPSPSAMNRRQFIRKSAMGAAALAGGMTGAGGMAAVAGGRSSAGGASRSSETSPSPAAPAVHPGRRPNIVLVFTDQQSLRTISALGCPHVETPAMDRLVRQGTTFVESHCFNPLCSPSRSSLLTGRATLETGVVVNNMAMIPGLPNLGQWLGKEGYETVYAGKWHLPRTYTTDIPGFRVIPAGINTKGELGDGAVSRACEGYLLNRGSKDPFLLVASLLMPHDICHFVAMHKEGIEALPFEGIEDELPPLPANRGFDPREPELVKQKRSVSWSDLSWRYFLWTYYRMIEMADAELGRILRALDASGQGENTLVIFTSDHGEGGGSHGLTKKNFLYQEALQVPLIICHPDRVAPGRRDGEHLVSNVDIMPTLCDFAGTAPPPDQRGRSLRPLLEGDQVPWSEFVAAECDITGKMIRTGRYKYVTYQGDSVEQLFDLKEDPGETRNLAESSGAAGMLEDHRRLLLEWEGGLKYAPGLRNYLKNF